MTLHFLIANKVWINALVTHNQTDHALVCRESVDFIGELYSQYPECCIWATAQTVDRVTSSSISGEQSTRFVGLVKEEKTTNGVKPFDPDTSTRESAISLSMKGHTIVVTEEWDINNIPQSKRLKAITPAQLLARSRIAKRALDYVEFNYLDLLKLLIMEPNLFFEKVNKNDSKITEPPEGLVKQA